MSTGTAITGKTLNGVKHAPGIFKEKYAGERDILKVIKGESRADSG